ncbi:hypothetical protein Acr_01g0015130 [Actinidia rufa]|uniref:RRM domain-containing protein n=1 Tax=Actinidia rufa TaxID=165716 RepID=A0A7J0E5U3_9ERIC|nr:hypothetical protein Acr_01g0015130 [Actinidia rufa]
MGTHQGIFPKVSHVKNSVGGSWYVLKDILSNVKDKMLGNPQRQRQKSTVISSEFCEDGISSTAASCLLEENSFKNLMNAKDSESFQSCANADTTALREPRSIVQSSRSLAKPDNDENNTTNATSHIKAECSSADSVHVEGSKVLKHQVLNKLAEPAHLAQLPEAEVVSHSNEKSIETSVVSRILGENSSKYVVQLGNMSDSSKLEQSEYGHMKPGRVASKMINFVKDHKPKSEKLSFFPKPTGDSRMPNSGSAVYGLRSGSSIDDVQKTIVDFFRKRINDRASGDMTSEKNDSMIPNCPEVSNETAGRGVVQSYGIKGLIDCINELPRDQSIISSHDTTVSNKTDKTSNVGAIRGTQSEANTPRSDIKRTNSSLKDSNNFKVREHDPVAGAGALFKIFGTNSKTEDHKGSSAHAAAFDCIKSKPRLGVPHPTSKQGLEGSDKNKVLIRFLPRFSMWSDIEPIFKDCGCITKIEFHAKGSCFKTACIYFKTKEGMQKALTKTGVMMKHQCLVLEAACSTDNNPSKTVIPDLIGFPDVPASLVKNPIRTVMIKELTPNISSSDIEKALAFCGSNVSGFFFGSSSSVAYVEFEREGGKQRALERHSVNVSGKQLRIFRIDVPRTTAVRISNLNVEEVKGKLKTICDTYGEVMRIVVRSKDIVDVHFKLAEWPNMLKILNGLNGLKVDDSQWIAQPAPVFPAEVLHVLWSHPNERSGIPGLYAVGPVKSVVLGAASKGRNRCYPQHINSFGSWH